MKLAELKLKNIGFLSFFSYFLVKIWFFVRLGILRFSVKF